MLDAKTRPRRLAVTASAILVGLLSLSPPTSAVEIGRLFFSPAERDLMDRERSVPFPCLKVNGVVVKNGQTRDACTDPVAASLRYRDDHRISLESPDDGDAAVRVRITAARGEPFVVRAGQMLDAVRGEVRETFDPERRRCAS